MSPHHSGRVLKASRLPLLLVLMTLLPWPSAAQLKLLCPEGKKQFEDRCRTPAEIRALKAKKKLAPAGKPVPRTSAWVTILGGTFTMGSNAAADEKPMHKVSIRSFQITRTEVTTAQYLRCVKAGVCRAPEWAEEDHDRNLKTGKDGHYKGFTGSRQPVVGVTFRDASRFCGWAVARLPSEAEWEYAARSRGRAKKYPWGDQTAT